MEHCGREWITGSPELVSMISVRDNLLQEGNGLFDLICLSLLEFPQYEESIWGKLKHQEQTHISTCVFVSQQTLTEIEVFTLSAQFTCAAWGGRISKGYMLLLCRGRQKQVHPACSCRMRLPECSSRMYHLTAHQENGGLSLLSQHLCWTMCWTAGGRTQRQEESSWVEQGKGWEGVCKNRKQLH